MAIDLINYAKIEDFTAAHESRGSIKIIEDEIMRILQSHNQRNQQVQVEEVKEETKAVRRTGHARFRRGPVESELVKPAEVKSNVKSVEMEMNVKSVKECKDVNSANSSGSSSITGEEGTVSNGKVLFAAGAAPAPRTYSSGKPPLPTSHRKRCRDMEIEKMLISKSSGSRGCHCCKRRYALISIKFC